MIGILHSVSGRGTRATPGSVLRGLGASAACCRCPFAAFHGRLSIVTTATDQWIAESRTRLKEYDQRRQAYQPISGRTMPDIDDLPIGGSRSFHLAVLSIDIRGFTSIALKLQNAEISKLAQLQALYLSEMSAIIRAANGATEKYTGDGVLGLFGTESETTAASDVKHACEAALTVNLIVRKSLNPYFRDLGLPEIGCGQGIDYGPVLMERVGAKGDNQFSLAGVTVSVAAKLQGVAKAGQVLVGEWVANRLPAEWKKRLQAVDPPRQFSYKVYDLNSVWSE